MDVIAKNPNCCFEVDKFKGKISYHCESRALCHLEYDSILAFSKTLIEKDEREKASLLQLPCEKYNEAYRKPISKGGKRIKTADLSKCCCVVMDIDVLTGRKERKVQWDRQKTTWRHYC